MQENEARTTSPADDLKLILEAAREAGEIALSYYRRDPEVWFKEGNSPVSAADLAVDRFLRDKLLAARPDYGWLSEETADQPDRLKAQRTFVVDPIDGTRAFIGGKDIWCVSIAVVENGRTIAGVLDCPARREVFTAAAGQGAFANGSAIAVRPQGGELRTQQRIPWPDEPSAVLRHQSIVVASVAPQVLIEQQVAIMDTVCQVIDYHDPSATLAQPLLPAAIERIVINDQPIGRDASDRFQRLRGIGQPIATQPVGMNRSAMRRCYGGRTGIAVDRQG